MTFTKTNFRTHLEANVYPQELSKHIIILFCNISEPFKNFSPRILQYWLASVNNASCYTDSNRQFVFYKHSVFIKLQKMEGEVFIALGTSQDDFEPPRVSISPQSPPSLKPVFWTKDMIKQRSQPKFIDIRTPKVLLFAERFWNASI